MPTFQRNVLVVLVLMALCGYSLFHYRHLPKTTDPTASRPPASVVADAPEFALLPLNETQGRPQTLSECMGPDNLIDEAAVTCRFGKSQKAVTGSTAQGMVSARYTSQYKAQQQMHQPRLAAAQFIESAIVWQWDRKRTYAAEWVVSGNQIDGTSVCRNWRRGSIEYRECRKGAKVYFKEQCKRLAESIIRQRYCSAASGFNPLG
ncbi:hypothetical protein [Pseudomonas syringae]|uniref:hypothetical protein n=1 Tax=Pseudomonas syringae TaxID=317 RepID=UPI0004640AE4|nr:hypothetical protein [Pseudomonas syringae]